MSILRNAIVCLEKSKIPIFKDTIISVLEDQINHDVKPKEMIANREKLVAGATALIEKEISVKKPINV